MKICKVEIIKRFKNGVCQNIYPDGYKAGAVNVLAYDENPLKDGDNTGYCIGIVADNFGFTSKMVEIDKSAADAFVDARAAVIEDEETRVKFANARKVDIAAT